MNGTTKHTRTHELRKTLADPTPLYFAAGVIDKIREVAPERLAAVKSTDPKAVQEAVQERVAEQAKHTQTRLNAALSEIDTDIRKLREQAQHLALQGVGIAAEYAVKAREGYDELAERGRGAVKTWRGEEEQEEKNILQKTGERDEILVFEPESEREAGRKPQARSAAGTGGRAARKPAARAASGQASTRRTTARTTAKSTGAKSTGGKSTGGKEASGPAAKSAQKTAQKQTPKTDKPQS